VPLSGVRKAARLLMSLDAPTAAELLQAVELDMLTEITAEIAYLSESEQTYEVASDEPVREFFNLLPNQARPSETRVSVEDLLHRALGEQQSQEILAKVNQRAKQMDPFRKIRSAEVVRIAKALEAELPQVVSIVLSELPPSKSQQVLSLLADEIRVEALKCMTSAGKVSTETKLRIATVVQSRLEQIPEQQLDQDSDRRQQLRKAALVLRGLDNELRETLIKSLADQDAETAKSVQDLMVLWEDIVQVADRPLQEALRSSDSRKLALALVDADERTAEKIRNNISERAKAMLEEETSLLSSPKKEDVAQAREDILSALRDLASRGELQFEEE